MRRIADAAPAGTEPTDPAPQVFDLRVFAEKGVSAEKLLYAGNVLAQLLDNDADGKVDNKKVWGKLKKIYGGKIKGSKYESCRPGGEEKNC